MAKVTSKLQVTIPKALAEELGIRPGDEIDWAAAGGAIRVTPARTPRRLDDPEERLRVFDAATERQALRQAEMSTDAAPAPADRGWTREDLHDRGRAD